MRYEELTFLEIAFMAFLIAGAISAAFGIMGLFSDYLIPRYLERRRRRRRHGG